MVVRVMASLSISRSMLVNGCVRSLMTISSATPRAIHATQVVYSTDLRCLNSSEAVSVVRMIRVLYRK